jgi:hypothetical protein
MRVKCVGREIGSLLDEDAEGLQQQHGIEAARPMRTNHLPPWIVVASIPKTNKNSYPIARSQPVTIQMNDVDIDHRGLAYASDRVGTGLFILEYTGRRPRQATSH